MISYSDLEKYDKYKIRKAYDLWPQIARDSYNSVIDSVDFKNIDHIVFAGMGGSGAIGDLFSSILSKSNIHVSLVKGYLLPNTVDKNTLVVTTSVSGNSSETLTVLNSATKLNCSLLAFSSGGKMEEICTKNNLHYRKIELIHSPRASFVKYVYSMLAILNSILPITRNEILESITSLQNIKSKIDSQNLSESNIALELANWIKGIPLIYYPHGLQSAAIRFKSSLQENAKSHAIIEDVIEACHNGIVAWETSSSVQPILIRGMDDYVKTKERWEIIKKYFSENNINFKEIISVQGSILSKLMYLIYLLDYTSIYKAIMNNIDPSPVTSIDFIKSKLE